MLRQEVHTGLLLSVLHTLDRFLSFLDPEAILELSANDQELP
jgi:hypothetical protein